MFRTHMFPGGVHPKEGVNGKTVTASMPIEVLKAPSRVVIPLIQHIGAPAKCVVKKGDRVLKGQLIGEAGGFVSANIHASVSGKVVSITQCLTASGALVDAVVIDNDFMEESVALPIPSELDKLSAKELCDYVRNAGIVGLGGATFPTAVKLSPPPEQKIDTLVINGAECEPYLTADHRLMLENATDILDGISLVLNALNIDKAIIGVENNKQDAIDMIKSTNSDSRISVVGLPVHYPQGGEKQLIYALTKRRVPNGALPLSIGIVVLNVGTAAAISTALRKGIPLIERVVTVGGMFENPGNFLVRVGTPVEVLVEAAGGLKKGVKQMVYGGPMMGAAISRSDIPVVKGCSGILAIEQSAMERYESACIRCGRCIKACPMQLVPTMIDQYMRVDDYDNAQKAGALNCLECGACTYVCPAKRCLTQSCRVCKRKINENIKLQQAKKEA